MKGPRAPEARTYVCTPVSARGTSSLFESPPRPCCCCLPPPPPPSSPHGWQFRSSSCARNEKRAWPGHKSLNPVRSSAGSLRRRAFSQLPFSGQHRAQGRRDERRSTTTGQNAHHLSLSPVFRSFCKKFRDVSSIFVSCRFAVVYGPVASVFDDATVSRRFRWPSIRSRHLATSSISQTVLARLRTFFVPNCNIFSVLSIFIHNK